MENSGTVMFEDDTPEWFVALGEGRKWMGPLSAADVYAKILSQEITWAHFVWRQSEKAWTRICDTKTFQIAVPEAPQGDVLSEIREAAKSPRGKAAPPPAPAAEEPRSWFLYYNTTQFGPFSEDEVRRAITSGKIHGRVHAWHEGMEGWERLEKLQSFSDALATAASHGHGVGASRGAGGVREAGTQTGIRTRPPIQAVSSGQSAGPREQRETPRAPLLAKILMASAQPGPAGADSAVSVAMCRDISVGGMQVLTDRIPGAVGSRIKMNVSATTNLDPFVAEGVIVRILEDKRGFSFRFDKLGDSAKKSIETYIRGLPG